MIPNKSSVHTGLENLTSQVCSSYILAILVFSAAKVRGWYGVGVAMERLSIGNICHAPGTLQLASRARFLILRSRHKHSSGHTKTVMCLLSPATNNIQYITVRETIMGVIWCPFFPNQMFFINNHNKFHTVDLQLLLLICQVAIIIIVIIIPGCHHRVRAGERRRCDRQVRGPADQRLPVWPHRRWVVTLAHIRGFFGLFWKSFDPL